MIIFLGDSCLLTDFVFVLYLLPSIQIVDVVADERLKLYTEFSAEELQQLLGLVRESSLKILELKQQHHSADPLAY